MAWIPEVKCSKCDRTYSGLRSKCPYCGARRYKQNKRASDGNDRLLKMIVSCALAIILVAAGGISIAGSRGSKSENKPNTSSKPVQSSTQDSVSSEKTSKSEASQSSESSQSVSSEASSSKTSSEASSSESESESESDSETEEGEVTYVVITYLGEERDDITLEIDEDVPLDFETFPDDVDAEATWSSSDEDVFTVSEDGRILGVGPGDAVLTVEVEGITAECWIRVP